MDTETDRVVLFRQKLDHLFTSAEAKIKRCAQSQPTEIPADEKIEKDYAKYQVQQLYYRQSARQNRNKKEIAIFILSGF